MNSFDTEEEVKTKIKWIPIYIWILIIAMGTILSVQILLKMSGLI